MNTKKITFFQIFVFIFFSSLSIYGQDEYVGKFTITAPDTVEQSQKFTVFYSLTTNEPIEIKNWGLPKSLNGFVVDGVVKGSKTEGHPFIKYNFRVTYYTSKTGLLELPVMSFPTGNSVFHSEKRSIFVKHSAEYMKYGEEIELAHKWLVNHGQHPDSINLMMGSDENGFRIFEDTRNHCFCIVAKKEFWHCIDNPILAFSTECAIHCTSERIASKQHNSIMSFFREQIAQLNNDVDKKDSVPLLYIPKHEKVMPLLQGNKWSQLMPYNLFTPTVDGKKTPVGCVPTAASIVVNYHKWPKQGHSNTYYKWGNKIFNFDFSTFKPQWEAYRDSYNPKDSTEESTRNMAHLLVFMAYSIDAKFRDQGTGAHMNKVKPIFVNNMGYSGHISYFNENNTSDEERIALLYRDLDEGRPCIVSNNSHAFVCDGYHGNFLHFNFGWGGQYNGFYRLALGNKIQTNGGKSLFLAKGVICGIEPLREEIAREVTLQEAGMLETMLSDMEKETITELIVSGPINGEDIRLLRKMAGANDELSIEGWRGGSLRKLNLSEAIIMKDKTPYRKTIANGIIKLKMGNGKMHTFDFRKMDKTEWKKFQNNLPYNWYGMYYSSTEDNHYWENFYIADGNTIGKKMFADCSSLTSIILPQRTKTIEDYAFQGCTSLKSIEVPVSTKYMGKDPFQNCLLLEEVKIPKIMSTNSQKICIGCSPVVKATFY